MNNILQLKGKFEYSKGKGGGGSRNIPVGKEVKISHVKLLYDQIVSLKKYWDKEKIINGALVSVKYYSVVAKSNRIRSLLNIGYNDPNDNIVGAKFTGNKEKKHIFTYYIDKAAIEESRSRIEQVLQVMNDMSKDALNHKDLEDISKNIIPYRYIGIPKTMFINVLVDCYYVEEFFVETTAEEAEDNSIVTLYKTDRRTEDLFKQIGLDLINVKKIDETTILLTPDEIKTIQGIAPYLISMKVRDMREILPEEVIGVETGVIAIPDPTLEPIIGVIDTPFHNSVYFNKWVEYHHMIDEDIEIEPRDYEHGTEVDSIIVDGATSNPSLDDGCGRFRVRHFGVAKKGRFSAYSILKAIRTVVSQNRDIKVWNLSLGSMFPINENYISPEAAELDRIQSEYDAVFVIAGTNIESGTKEHIPIGAPADSLNSIVVNSVRRNNMPASYHRVGPVLSFFHKPDLSYYGGDVGEEMRVCTPTGEAFVKGTSFSAPWISRKLAFLIYKLGLTREVAKALLIDAAAGWNRQDDYSCSVGYGVVPIRIEDIVKAKDDEIRFFLSGTTDEYETYTYRLPIPVHNNKHPFYARATLCYFPKCARDQGVDYTTTEMDIHFGRVKETNGKVEIKSINNNFQGELGDIHLHEKEARQLYRKWDNVKLVSEEIKERRIPRAVYGTGMWGLSIKTKERLKEKNGRGLTFGVVITLKEMNGINRFDDFKKMCQIKNWIVNEIDIEGQVDVYNKAEEELLF